MTNLSRRDFVRSAALAAATLAASKNLPAQTHERQNTLSPIRLGLASYTFRNFSRAQMIAFMKQLNVSDLNAKDAKDHLPFDPPQESAALADYAAANIKLHAAGVISLAKNDDTDMRAKFDYCKRANLTVMVGGDPTPETLPLVEKLAREYDMRVAIHNHGPEDKLWKSPLDVLMAVQNMDPRLGCCVDVGHTARAGVDVIQAIHRVGPRVFNIHMKDLTSFSDRESQVAVGDGKMPVRQILEALIAMHYSGFVDLEYEVHPDDPMPGVIASFAYMRGMLAGMGTQT
jgi:sugar phosphate isomerase/epimerase